MFSAHHPVLKGLSALLWFGLCLVVGILVACGGSDTFTPNSVDAPGGGSGRSVDTSALEPGLGFVISTSGKSSGKSCRSGKGAAWTVNRFLDAPETDQERLGGGLCVKDVRACEYWPPDEKLYAIAKDRFGHVRLTDGEFERLTDNRIYQDGSGADFRGFDDGSLQMLRPDRLNDVRGMAIDPTSGNAFAVARVDGPDVFFRFDLATGVIRRDSFLIDGVSYDYIRLKEVRSDFERVECVAIDPLGDTIYAMQAEDDNDASRLVRIVPSTGQVLDVGPAEVDDVRGLGFCDDGVLWATTGDQAENEFEASLFQVDTTTGRLHDWRPLEEDGKNYETCTFLTGGFNTFCGRVYCANLAGVEADADRVGAGDVRVILWRDVDANGRLDPEEDVTLDVTRTDANGDYCFSVVADGAFLITVDTATLPAGFILVHENLRPVEVEGFGHVVTGLDFVKVPASRVIGDTVFLDRDQDGVHDASEPGLEGVLILRKEPGVDGVCGTADDVEVETVLTAGGGFYLFQDVPDGTWCIEVETSTLSPDAVLTTANQPLSVTITAGSHELGADFGYFVPSSIGDTVFLDMNENLKQDPGEPGLPDVLLTLTSLGADRVAGTADDVVIGTQRTDAQGNYRFGGLAEGAYHVEVDETTAPAGTRLTTLANPVFVDLLLGESRVDVDFGLFGAALIGDLVWHDQNRDGVIDAGEPPLSGVVVTLLGAGPDGLLETPDDHLFPLRISDLDGFYEFAGLLPGLYRVATRSLSLPPQLRTPTTPNPLELTLAQTDVRSDIDFGIAENIGTIGNLVWNDLDGDGLKDPNELGLAGVAVRLFDPGPDGIFDTPDDILISTQITDADGLYRFTTLPPGTFRVVVDETSLPAGLGLTTGNQPLDVDLAPSAAFDEANFGYWESASIAGRVWDDLNGDGVADAGEPGIAGVTVSVSAPGADRRRGTADDVGIRSLVTGPDGEYLFAGLAPGLYSVEALETTLPTGYVRTTLGNPINLLLLPGAERMGVDFGFWRPASVGEFVWDDLDGDGTQDAGEPGLLGVQLDLIDAGTDGILGTADDFVRDMQTTDVNGFYEFANQAPGIVRVSVEPGSLPAGFALTTANQPLDLSLVAGQIVDTANFGYWRTTSVEGVVFEDLTGNALRDPEDPGLAGVTLHLRGAGIDGVLDTPDDTTFPPMISDANGAWAFVDLVADLYRVTVDAATIPAGMALTTGNVPFEATLAPGDHVKDTDFGYRHTGQLGDLVWNDLDGNGVQDAGEPGLVGVTLRLAGAGPDGVCGTPDDVMLATTTTDAQGGYGFDGLAPATYCVDVDDNTVPAGFVPTVREGIQTVVLPAGQDQSAIDFAFRKIASIGDLVWHDLNPDGLEDPGEPGLAGVTVTLVERGPDTIFRTIDDISLGSQVTDADGRYRFDDLFAGTYEVSIDLSTVPAGMAVTNGALPRVVVLAAGEGDATVDFGFQFVGGVSGRVGHDAGADGSLDPGDAGILKAVVNLVGAGPDGQLGTADDIQYPSSETPGDGSYSFSFLPPDLYRVTVDPDFLLPGLVLTTDNQPFDTEITEAAPAVTEDFGYEYDGRIGSLVFLDRNGNAIPDAGEPGLAGVTVRLEGMTRFAVTDANGRYAFEHLPPNAYLIAPVPATLPPGVVLTTDNVPYSTVLEPHGQRDDANFGYRDSGVLGDRVWEDTNRDGVQDPTEVGIANVTLRAIEAGPDGILGTADDVALPDQKTDLLGAYSYANLPGGLYRVSVEEAMLPPGMSLTGGTQPSDVTLASGEVNNDVDFGYAFAGEIRGRVWRDLNGDGIQDAGEPGLVAVTVLLIAAGPDGQLGTPDDIRVGDQGTVADGLYGFIGLAPDLYRVDVPDLEDDTGLEPTTDNVPFDLNLAPSQVRADVDFGFDFMGAIEGVVFRDRDLSGVRDPLDPGLPGVGVTLAEAGTDGALGTPDDVVLPPAITGPLGGWAFVQLPPGLYRVDVPGAGLPAGVTLTTGNVPSDITLAKGDTESDSEFGYEVPASIGDRVWDDVNGDGIQDGGEPGLNGVQVDGVEAGSDGKFDTPDDVALAPAVTAGDGDYLFSNLPAGRYRLRPDGTSVPGNRAPTTPKEVVVDLATGASFPDADFGWQVLASIAGIVWHDLNENGTQDAGEPGLGGVSVSLSRVSDSGSVGVVLTAADGSYSFADLDPQPHRVLVDTATLPAGMTLTTANQPLDIDLSAGQAVSDADIGYAFAGSIGDRVWHDLNFDGVQNGGEPGLVGVTVTLLSAGADGVLGTGDDADHGSQVTGADGAYLFEMLAPDLYRVDVPGTGVPAGFVLTTDNLPLDVDLAPSQAVVDADFGYQTLSSIGDRVWEDTNGNGVQDAGEPGLNGVTLRLARGGLDRRLGTRDDLADVTTVTAGDGDYSFPNLEPGAYRVLVDTTTLPAGLALTTGNQPLLVFLDAATDRTDADFGYRNTSVIGHRVWRDLDRDGVEDAGEEGLSDVTVDLREAGPDGVFGTADDVLLPAATTVDGSYAFLSLAPGLYRVTVDTATLATGLVLTTANQPLDISLAAGQVVDTANFGYQYEGAVGGRVWNDLDGDGVQDAGEPSLAGVRVDLVSAGPDGILGTADDILQLPEITDAGGLYTFDGLAPGPHRQTVDVSTLPAGMALTTANQPLDTTLTAGQKVTDADVGFALAGSIGDRVWMDDNFNGVQDAGEPGLNGVTVDLVEAGPDGILGSADDVVFPAAVTAGDGDYGFPRLAEGLYRVTLSGAGLPAGHVLTTGNLPFDTTLTPAQVVSDADFGFQGHSSIAGRVWNDLDGSGSSDAGEPGLNGVTVDLIEAGPDRILGTADDITFVAAMTSGDGDYAFAMLAPGSYRVTVDASTLPEGMELTSGNQPLDLTLAAATDLTDADVGYAFAGSLGNRVWHDLDFDGVQGPGEPGLNGVTVELVAAGADGMLGTPDDVVFPPQVSAGDGDYAFLRLEPGTYRVTVPGAGLPAAFVVTTGNLPFDHVLAANENVLDADFGYQQYSSLGDRVWDDINGDGVQDAGEPGLNGVRVELVEAGPDGMLATPDDISFPPATTTGDGDYGFASLEPGLYRVTVDAATLPGSHTLTTGNQPLDLLLPAATDIANADFGYQMQGSIAGVVWHDLNADGVRDAGEPGLEGVRLTGIEAGPDGLLGTPDDVALPPQVTPVDGSYGFALLPAGLYRIRVDPATVPGGTEVTTGNQPYDRLLGQGQVVVDADFGYQAPAMVVGRVWSDLNEDGVQDPGEPGLAGVLVELRSSGLDGMLGTGDDVVEDSATTVADGTYGLSVLLPGTFHVLVDETTTPAEWERTSANPKTVTLAAAEQRTGVDFGYALVERQITGIVWLDSDQNGLYEPAIGEVPIPDVTLTLRDGQGVELATATTDAEGRYLFEVGGPGEYTVVVDASNFEAGGALENLESTTGGDEQIAGVTVFKPKAGSTRLVTSLAFGYFRTTGGGVGPGDGLSTCGWWATHPDQWPLDPIPIDGVVLTKEQARAVLDKGNLIAASFFGRTAGRTNAQADMVLRVTWALIGAKLNVANGVDASKIAQTIRDADAWLTKVGLTSTVWPGNPDYPEGRRVHDLLNKWNKGEL